VKSLIALVLVSCALPSFVFAQTNDASARSPLSPNAKKKTVAILIFNGVQIIDYAGPYEVLGSSFKVNLVAETGDPITTVMGMKVMPHYSFDSAPKADIIVIPGGVGTLKERQNPKVIKWIQDAAQSAEVVLGVCTGSELLASAGLLDGIEATGNAGALRRIQDEAPKAKIVGSRVVDAGKIVTSGGLSAGIDGALHVVEKIYGAGIAQFTARAIEYNWQPSSSYAAAFLADKFIKATRDKIVFDPDALLTEYSGDRDRWTLKAEVSAASQDEVISRISTTLVTDDHWVRRAAKEGAAPNWLLTDDDGHSRSATVAAQSVAGKPNDYVLTLVIVRVA